MTPFELAILDADVPSGSYMRLKMLTNTLTKNRGREKRIECLNIIGMDCELNKTFCLLKGENKYILRFDSKLNKFDD